MILIPAGSFVFRYDGERFEAEGLHDHAVDQAAFCIDEFEYPNQVGVLPTPVSWNDAQTLCAAEGKRLCTGEEWQKACAGPDGRQFTWGDAWDDQVCNTHTDQAQARQLAPSGAWPACRSYYGVYDMGGNVSEWTADVWQAGWPDMTVRGGGYNRNELNSQELKPDGFWQFTNYSQRCSSIHHHHPDVLMTDDGVRCCADL
jgi:formylglycine-generating enzyme required for sulfatase activity